MAGLNINKKVKVAVGLSGGVDSSVSAYLLKSQGFDVEGVHLQCWDYSLDGCTGEQDRADAVKVASLLDIPFTALNFETAYRDKVISYFYDEYRNGRTPNPDVLCNKEIKFGLFLEWALQNGFDYVATGHYAKVEHTSERSVLLAGIDPKKDQSYFLYQLNEHQLAHSMFPLGDMHKEEIRQIAKKIGLPNAAKKDSVGICFVGNVDVREFLKKEIPENLGKVLDGDGNIVGEHIGVAFYTIGQRHGFKLTKYFGVPMYVIGKDATNNTITVGNITQVNAKSFEVAGVTWQMPFESVRQDCFVRIRHLGNLYPCTITASDNGVVLVVMHDSVFAVTPGQSAVFYDYRANGFSDLDLPRYVIGGGTITQSY